MIIKYITAYFDLFLFFSVEIILVISFFVFKRYSRNHGGAFDRRIDQRRSFNRRTIDNISGNMGLISGGTDSLQYESSTGNESFDISVENFLTGRRSQQRRDICERRKSM